MDNIIKEFEKIRDLKYEFGPLHEGKELIQYGKGGCGPKNRYLANYFYKLGYDVKVCTSRYSWKDLEFLPVELKKHPRAKHIGNHVYLKVKIDGKWALVDASWDKGLRSIFPVNLNWDGVSNQISATKIKEEICYNYPEPYLGIRKNKKPSRVTTLDRDFAKKFNKYLESIRKSNIY
jgi:arylamine N-acetyltransferase